MERTSLTLGRLMLVSVGALLSAGCAHQPATVQPALSTPQQTVSVASVTVSPLVQADADFKAHSWDKAISEYKNLIEGGLPATPLNAVGTLGYVKNRLSLCHEYKGLSAKDIGDLDTAGDEFQSAVTVDSHNKTAKRLLAEVHYEQDPQSYSNPAANTLPFSLQKATTVASTQAQSSQSNLQTTTLASPGGNGASINGRLTQLALDAARRANPLYMSPSGVASVTSIEVKDISNSASVLYPYDAHVDIMCSGLGKFYTYTIGINPDTGATSMKSIEYNGEIHDPSDFTAPPS